MYVLIAKVTVSVNKCMGLGDVYHGVDYSMGRIVETTRGNSTSRAGEGYSSARGV